MRGPVVVIGAVLACALLLLLAMDGEESNAGATVPQHLLERAAIEVQLRRERGIEGRPIVRATYVNHSGERAWLCTMLSPLEGVRGDILFFEPSVQHVGMMAKRMYPPPPESFVMLEAGQELTAEMLVSDIGRSYGVTPGASYEISLGKAPLIHVFADSLPSGAAAVQEIMISPKLRSNSVSVTF